MQKAIGTLKLLSLLLMVCACGTHNLKTGVEQKEKRESEKKSWSFIEGKIHEVVMNQTLSPPRVVKANIRFSKTKITYY